MSFATLRIAARRSFALFAFFSSGSSRTLMTRSIWARSWSVGSPARAGRATRSSARTVAHAQRPRRDVNDVLLDLAEDVFRQQLLEVDGRLDLSDPATGRDDLLGPARADAHVFLPDQPLRLDRRDRILLQLDPSTDPEGHERLVVLQADVLDAPDLDARDLHRRAGLHAAHRRKVGKGRMGAAAEGGKRSREDGKKPQMPRD